MNIELQKFAYIYDYRYAGAAHREGEEAKKNPPEARFVVDREDAADSVIYGMCFEEPREIGDVVVELEQDFPAFPEHAFLQTYAPKVNWISSLTWTWHQGEWEPYRGYPKAVNARTFVYPGKMLMTSKLRFKKSMPIDINAFQIKSVHVHGLSEYTECSLTVHTGLWGHEAVRPEFGIYNGEIVSIGRSIGRTGDTSAELKLLITRKPYDKYSRTDSDRTVLTVSLVEDGAPSMVSFLPVELDAEPYICIPDFGVLAYSDAKKLPGGIFENVVRTGEKIRERVKKAPQRTFEMTQNDIGLKPVNKTPETENFALLPNPVKLGIPDKRMEKQWDIGLSHLMAFCSREENGGWNVRIGPYPMIAQESVPIMKMLDLYGRGDVSRGGYEKCLDTYSQRTPEGLFQTKEGCLCLPYGIKPGDSWLGFDPGSMLIGLSEHYLVTRDDGWLKTAADRMLGCCDWILNEIAFYKTEGAWDEGMLPPMIHGDMNDWFSSYCVNSEYYKGLDLALKVVSKLGGHYLDEAKKRRPAADEFCKAIRSAYRRSVRLAPVVKLRDGTYAPGFASCVYMRGLVSDIYPYSPANGLRNAWLDVDFCGFIADAGIFAADEKETRWMLDCMEDRIALDPFLVPKKWDEIGPCPVTRARDATRMNTDFDAERDWYAWGGTGWQNGYCRLSQVYAKTGETNAYIRTYYNTYAIEADPETFWFREHAGTMNYPPKTFEEGVMLLKFRTFFIDENDGGMDLFSFVPDNWFAEGFQMENAPTFFGRLTFRVESDGNKIRAHIQLEKTDTPKTLRVRLVNAGGEKPESVAVNGKTCGPDCIGRDKPAIILDPTLDEWDIEAAFN